MQAKLSFPEAEEMKSLYNKVFKNNQVTYGRPFQMKIPLKMQNIVHEDNDYEDGTAENADIDNEITPEPEDLLEKAKNECDLLIKEAGLEADRLLEQARLEAEKKAESLKEEAWQKGYAEGMDAAGAQYESIISEAEQMRQSAAEEHESIMAGLEAEMIDLVLGIARKAVAGELTANRDVILQLIKDAVPNCSNKNGAVLKACPADYDYINDNREQLLTLVEGADELEIKKDCTLKPGDCIIETPLGSVDAGVNTRLNKIEEAFREELDGR
jgi:flagellar assembly protein FliH